VYRARFSQYACLWLILAAVVVSAVEQASGQSGIIRPRRLVSLFDFEEPDNYESLPKNWFVIGRTAERQKFFS
jgi:hypothetical protein